MLTKRTGVTAVKVITLGCSKNLVDSENLMSQLKQRDWSVTHNSADEADIVIVNTCGFINLAKEESIDTILFYAKEKEKGNLQELIVTGCLSQRYKEDLQREIPEVDAWFGTMDMPLLLERYSIDYKKELLGERPLSTPSHYAYMKISEGCNRTCAFCAIPLMRGKHRSRPIQELVREAEALAQRGVKELMLIAQESTYYGLDLYKERALPKLLRALDKVDGIEWIRLHYAYPAKFPMDVLKEIQELSYVCPYIDIPLQHASDDILKKMRRQTTRDYQSKLIKAARDIIPDIAIRTTFLVGFPGETEEDFQQLLDFTAQHRFDRMGVFEYSHEENTRAAEFNDDVPPEEKSRRAHRLMELQKVISLEKNKALIGKNLKIIIDRVEGEYLIGRTRFDSPEVDNQVFVEQNGQLFQAGDFVEVIITEAEAYDLWGKISEK